MTQEELDLIEKALAPRVYLTDEERTQHQDIIEQARTLVRNYQGENILGRTIYIEDTAGDALMIIQISEQGRITLMDNCNIADIEDNKIRIQQVREVK